jgi:hypothetical protein
MVDIVISLLYYSDVLHAKGFSLSIFLVCIIIGLVYLSVGILIAVFKGKRAEK